MRLVDDDRGQSVQVGAAILLGFVVIAITIYQVEVVPDQNAEVEFNHQQDVRQEMIDLRNAISNAGTTGESEATTVTLGTQYPARTIFLNPPSPRGILRTQSAGNLSLSNADVGSGSYTGNPDDLIDDEHRTNRLVYAPNYAEFGQPGNLTVEHSLAFARFDNGASDSVTPQSVLQGDSLTLTMLRGNVAEQGTGPVSVDPRTVSRTDRITIEPNGSNPIVLTLPTRTPAVWNETIGLTEDDGEPDAWVESWDADVGEIQVVLNRSEYQLRMAMVGVGTGVGDPDGFDVQRQDGSGGGGAYDLFWEDPSSEEGMESADCDVGSCTWNRNQDSDSEFELTAGTNPSIDSASVDFAVGDSSVVEVSGDGETSDGTITATVEPVSTGTTTVYASSSGDTATIEITIADPSGGSGEFDPIVDDFENGLDLDDNANWSRESADQDEVDIEEDASTANSPRHAVRIGDVGGNGGGIESTTLDTSGLFQVSISAAIRQGGTDPPDDGEDLVIEYRDSSGNWVEADREVAVGSNRPYTRLSATLSDSAALHSDFAVRIVQESSNYPDLWYVDDICVVSSSGDCPFGDDNDGGDGSGTDVELVSGSASSSTGDDSRLDFEVTNSADSDRTITGIQIESAGGNLHTIQESEGGSGAGNREVYIASSEPGYLELGAGGEYTLGTYETLSNSATLTSGENAQVTALHFRNNGGNPVSVAGRELTVTFYFQGGGSSSFTFTPSS